MLCKKIEHIKNLNKNVLVTKFIQIEETVVEY